MVNILIGTIAGGVSFLGYMGVSLIVFDKQLQKYNVNIDVVNKNLEIRCKANKIPQENFKVYARFESGKHYLYVIGASVSDNNRDIIKVRQKYLIDNGDCANFSNISWSVIEDDVVVNIPLDSIGKKLKVKKVAMR